MKRGFTLIHKYTQNGHNIVLDVNSGAVHLLDGTAFRLLEYIDGTVTEGCPQSLIEKLPDSTPEEIREAYSELYSLYKSGQLFSPDDYGRYAREAVLSPVKAMCLNVSHDCNLRCAYCFAGKGDYATGSAMMSAEVGRKAIDYLVSRSHGRKFLEVDFFGGEPLMNFDTVRETVAYARSIEEAHGKKFRFTITTNGLLLDDGKIAYINENMDNVVLSLDGRKSVTDRVRSRVDGSGCYDAVVPKFQKLVESRAKNFAKGKPWEYYVRGTFTKYNKDFAEDVAALRALGFDQISIEPVVAGPKEPYALSESDLPEIFAEYERLADNLVTERKAGGFTNFFHFMLDLEQGPCAIKRLRGCGCGNEYIAVTPQGDVYPCHQFIGFDHWKMGNVFDGTLDEDIKLSFAKATIYDKEDCVSCWAKFYCSGGCDANNMQYEGDILKPVPLSCEMEKKRIECAIAIQAALA